MVYHNFTAVSETGLKTPNCIICLKMREKHHLLTKCIDIWCKVTLVNIYC